MIEMRKNFLYRPAVLTERRGGVFFRGLGILISHWRCLTWLWFLNLLLAFFGSVGISAATHNRLDTSLYSAGISHTLDMGVVADLMSNLKEAVPAATGSAIVMDMLYFLLVFIAMPGILACYLGDEIASLGNMFRVGLRFFWRFVRFGIVALIISAIVVGAFGFLRTVLLKVLDAQAATKANTWIALGTAALIFLVIVLLRLWFDLCEVLIVDRGAFRLGRGEDRRAVRTFGPGWRLMARGFAGVYGLFFLIGALGWVVEILCLLAWRGVAPEHPWRGFLLGQIGLFFLLAARLWQRGIEVAWFEKAGAPLTAVAPELVVPTVHAGGPDVISTPPAEPVSWPAPDPDPSSAPGVPAPQPPHAPPADVRPGPITPGPDEPGALPGSPLPA